MNVVQREITRTSKNQVRPKNEFVRKDTSIGIRGASLVSVPSYNTNNTLRLPNKTPRYQFNLEHGGSKTFMGPPALPTRSLKRKIVNSSSTKLDSSSGSKQRARILASDSCAADTSHDICTPRNRPTALRYISSSSRGGHSGTRSARSTSTSVVSASVILAISEGRGMARGEIGMAAVDLRHPHLVLCQFSDTLLYTHTLTKINFFNPVEIIVPHTFCEGVQPNQLYQLIKDQYPLLNLTAVQRRHFNDAVGRQQIQTLCAPQYSAVYLQVLPKFYALTAAAAVLKYVEYIQCIVFARESLKIEYNSSENTMIIDVGTATQLELVQPLAASAGPSCCLLGVLGPTFTIGGIRALRAAILQPSCNKEFIEARLDAVQELIESDTGLMIDLQDVLKKLTEIDKILFLCIETPNQNMDRFGEAQLNQVILLKTTMDMVPKLVEALQKAESGRLRRIKMDFENPHYDEIAERIRNIIQDDAHIEKGAMGSLQRCFAVKPDINGLLDVARRTYSELIDDIQKIVEQLSESYDLPMRLHQNVIKGFHIVLPVAPKNRRHFNVEDLPPIFIQVVFNGTSVSMTTEELVVLDQQAKASLSEIQKMSNIVIHSLLKELRPFMSSLYKLCENVAELDILLALAQTSSIGSYIRPEFNDYMEIRNSVHPLLDYNSLIMPVPNDIFSSPELNFTIITGPNMGGKSIYIKQIAILQIMAQLGCFVPATNAVFRMCDRLFSRIGFNDSVELNVSTYVLEMKETQHILKGLTPSSLVIIDELCRGTSVEEGTSMAWAICEELILSQAFTFFTTHFMYLTRLQDLYFNVVNLHTAVSEEEIPNTESSHKRLIYQHRIEQGVTKIERYGLALAAKTNIPEETVNLATELAELIAKNRKPLVVKTPIKVDEELLYKFNANLKLESRKNQHNANIAKQMIQKFINNNIQIVERLRIKKRTEMFNSNSNADGDFIVNTRHESINDNNENNIELNNHAINVNENTPDKSKSNTITDESFSEKEDVVFCNNTNDTNHTCVRSSTELLNTFIHDFSYNDETENFQNIIDYDNSTSSENNRSFCGENNSVIVDTFRDEIPTVNHFSSEVSSNDMMPKKIDIKDKLYDLMHVDYIIDEELSSDDSQLSLADAKTQVIESTETDEQNADMTLDEAFIRETIKEINEELNHFSCYENILLTPPLQFQDL